MRRDAWLAHVKRRSQQDVKDLHGLGYAQELLRTMGGFSNFAISFSIISILTGAVILYDYGLAWAGTAAVDDRLAARHGLRPRDRRVDGRDRVRLSRPPAACTTGPRKMKNKNWGWWTAWLNLIGQFAIVAGHRLRGGRLHQRHDRRPDLRRHVQHRPSHPGRPSTASW